MGKEIERKFLVKNADWRNAVTHSERMSQGYLSSNPKCSIRVRISDQAAYLNIKSATLGIERQEFEYAIPVEDADEMLKTLCQGPTVEKVRHHVPHENHLWEVDEFSGANAGLIVAEIELADTDEAFELPTWCGKEVSDDPRYYNVLLAQHPYSEWDEALVAPRRSD